MVSTNLIDIDEKEAQLYFIPLMLQDGEMKKSLGEMPMVRLGGAEGIRTPDLLLAKQALSRLSYSPTVNYCIRY